MEYLVLQTNGLFKKFSTKEEVQQYALKEGKGLIAEIIETSPESKLKFNYVQTFQLGGF